MISPDDIVAHYTDSGTGSRYSVRFTPLKWTRVKPTVIHKVDVYENGHAIDFREEFWGAPSLQAGQYILEEALNKKLPRPTRRLSAKHEPDEPDYPASRGTSWGTRVPVQRSMSR